MSDPSRLFDEYYYENNCGRPYTRDETWLASFDRIAQRVIEDFHPRTVLDAGCAWGFLVERLRARGVEAYGIDISEYAIAKVHPDIRPYCRVGSITEPFPQKYDLIVNIEVLEHMQPSDAERAIENFAYHSDQVLFSSSPLDYKEATHFNVLQPDEWARLFARYGLFRDLDYDISFILTPWASYYRRIQGDPVQPVVQAYERKLLKLQNEVRELRASLVWHHSKLQESNQQAQPTQSVNVAVEQGASPREMQDQLRARTEECEQLRAKAAELESRWVDLQQGRGWKMLQKVQSIRVGLFPPGSKREKVLDRIFKH